MFEIETSSLTKLQQLISNCESDLPVQLTDNQLRLYFDHLTKASSDPEGYHTLCWEAGEWLLLLAGSQEDTLFEEFGYSTISIALSSAIADRNLPQGLGWYKHEFVPSGVDGEIMVDVLSNPTVETMLIQAFSDNDFYLNFELLDPEDDTLCSVAIEFLSHLHKLGIPRSTQLMWAVRVFDYLPSKSPTRAKASRLILECLVDEERYVNAFYWLQAFYLEVEIDQELEICVFDIISKTVDLSLSGSDKGHRVIESLLNNRNQLIFATYSKRVRILFLILMLWILLKKQGLINYGYIEHVVNPLWEDYRNISLFVIRLTKWGTDILDKSLGSSIDISTYVRGWKNRSQNTAVLHGEIERPRNYRNDRKPIEIWRECGEEVFLPLLQSLDTARNLSQLNDIRRKLEELNPVELVRNSEVYKSSGRKLRGNSHKMLLVDITEFLQNFKSAIKSQRLVILTQELISQLSEEVRWFTLRVECDELIASQPSIEGYFTKYFVPLVDEWEELCNPSHSNGGSN